LEGFLKRAWFEGNQKHKLLPPNKYLMKKKSPAMPYSFVLDYLPEDITVKPMFGVHVFYRGPKTLFLQRKKITDPEINGIWVAIMPEYVADVKTDIPSLADLGRHSGKGQRHLIPEANDDFETDVLTLCRMISNGDGRMGKVRGKK
jgi:hypothetical protein